MKLTSQEIRQKYLKFFESKGHKIVPSSPLIPENDPTTLFTGSGMQPMVPYLLGEKHPLGTKITDSQKSFRSGDIEDIGDNRHTTFFEMLGNWSFGDYFKSEQIPWMFEFLTKEIGLNPERLYVSVYRGNKIIGIGKDEESANIWKEMFKSVGIKAEAVDMAEQNGMQGGKIFYYNEKENWWSRAGVPENMPVGEPGGPDSEMFWDFGESLGLHEKSKWKEEPCHPACDCGRFLEIGNNVFMQYKKTENIILIDGIECIFAPENKDGIFEIYEELAKYLSSLSNRIIILTNPPKDKFDFKGYDFEFFGTNMKYNKLQKEYYDSLLEEFNLNKSNLVYFEHNEEAVKFANEYGIKSIAHKNISDTIKNIGENLTGFTELKSKNIDFGGGLERLAVALADTPDVFMGDLFDGVRNKIEELTGKKYGDNENETKDFRIIMDHLRAATFLIADGAVPSNKDQGYFTRRLIRRAIRFAKDLGVQGGFIEQVAEEVIKEYSDHYRDLAEKRDFILKEMYDEEAQFLATLEKGLKELKELVEKKGKMVAQEIPEGDKDFGSNKSSKYVGNQISGFEAFDLFQTYGFPLELIEEELFDKGVEYEDILGRKDNTRGWFGINKYEFTEAKKKHQELSRVGAEQKFKGGLADHSEMTTALHSATHLMLAGLRKILGSHVHQAGSNITAERLRFDFTHPEKVSAEDLQKVENFVNNSIESSCEVELIEIAKTEAEVDPTIEGSFWEKYPEIVKVYIFKDYEGNIYSKELCGGPHVKNTGEMGRFKILKEEASSRGVRRIKAVLVK